MRLWLLTPREMPDEDDPWDPWYNKVFGFVVRAETEAQARETAETYCGYESSGKAAEASHVWIHPVYTDCVPLTVKGPPGLILRDFRES